MNPQFLLLLHLFSLLVLTAHTYMVFANPDPASKKGQMIITGVASLLMLLSAGALMGVHHYAWSSGWVIVKLVCWLGFSSLAGMAYRKTQMRGLLSLIGLLLLLVALVMVLFKPF